MKKVYTSGMVRIEITENEYVFELHFTEVIFAIENISHLLRLLYPLCLLNLLLKLFFLTI